MFALPVLFAILSVLAHGTSASDHGSASARGLLPADGQPCSVHGKRGVLDGVSCIAGGIDLTKRLLGNGLLTGNDRVHSNANTPYGFGWFHPGAFREGDRCWQNDREGLIANALCIVADIEIGNGNKQAFNGWFDTPYYGYGHRFGWYHPGPYLNGDRCLQDGWNGMVRDGLCIQLDATTGRGQDGGLLKGLSLGRRSLWGPDYWQEPRFSPGHSFGWFHDGQFANGDRCWSEGYYGTVTDSLCVLAKVDLNLKRDDKGISLLTNVLSGGGRSSYKNGERCFKQDNWGKWWHNDCAIAGQGMGSEVPFQEGDRCWRAGEWGSWRGSDCVLSLLLDIKRDVNALPYLFRDDPRLGRGVPCTKDGRDGILRDTTCIIANVDINLHQRDQEDDVAEGVTWSFEGMPYQSDEGSYDPEHDESYNTEEFDEMRKRSPLLTFTPGDNRDHAVSKTIDSLVGDIKSRNILGGSNSGGVSHLDKLMGLSELKGLDQVGGLTQPKEGSYRPSGGKSDGLLGGLLNGGLLGKRNFGHRSTEDATKRNIGGLGGLGGLTGTKGAHGDENAVGSVLNGVGGTDDTACARAS